MSKAAKKEHGRTRCQYCPNFLTDPVSVARGAGPVCFARALAAAAGQVDKPKPRRRKPTKKRETATDPSQLAFPFCAVEVQP